MEYICPECSSTYGYHDGNSLACPECGHTWHEEENNGVDQIVDANGVVLTDGDTVLLIKDLKIKGSSQVIKQGTKVKGIRLQPDSDHNIACEIEGSAMNLKSEFVKKV